MVKISQAQIQKLLENNKGKWFTTRQIAERISINESSSSRNIRGLGMHGLVKRRVNPNNPSSIEYSYLHQESMIRKKPLSVKKLNEEFKE